MATHSSSSRRFEHSEQWVSSQLALIQTSPELIQDQARLGALSGRAVMSLVPLARTDVEVAARFAAAMIASRGFNRTTIYKWMRMAMGSRNGLTALSSTRASSKPRSLTAAQEHR